MMFASRNRSKAIRRLLPLNRGARDAFAKKDAGRNAGEDRICCGGAPARRGGSLRRGADRALSDGEITVSGLGHHLGPEEPGELAGDGGGHDRAHVLVGSELAEPPREPDLCGPRAGYGLGGYTHLALSDAGAHVRTVLVGPGRFAELTPQMGIAGPGDRAPTLGETRRVLPGHEAGEAHEASCLREAAPVEDLGSQAERPTLVTPR